MDHNVYITCDEDQRFVLTQFGYFAASEELREKQEMIVGEPLKGYEYSVPEFWYVQGWVEKADKI